MNYYLRIIYHLFQLFLQISMSYRSTTTYELPPPSYLFISVIKIKRGTSSGQKKKPYMRFDYNSDREREIELFMIFPTRDLIATAKKEKLNFLLYSLPEIWLQTQRKWNWTFYDMLYTWDLIAKAKKEELNFLWYSLPEIWLHRRRKRNWSCGQDSTTRRRLRSSNRLQSDMSCRTETYEL